MHETVKRGRDRVGILVFVLLVLSHTQEFPHPPINTYFHKYMNKVFYAIYGDTLKKGEWTSNFQPIWKFWEKTPLSLLLKGLSCNNAIIIDSILLLTIWLFGQLQKPSPFPYWMGFIILHDILWYILKWEFWIPTYVSNSILSKLY